MAAVYELATVKPHVPLTRRYKSTEWVAYCEGYYQALVMALRVMQAALGRWEIRTMQETTTKGPRGIPVRPDSAARAPAGNDPVRKPLLIAIAAVGGLFVLELLVLLAALIYRAVR